MPETDTRAAENVLKSLPARDRDAMVRFFFERQSAERIQADLRLSDGELERIKSQAKSMFLLLRRKPAQSEPMAAGRHIENRPHLQGQVA